MRDRRTILITDDSPAFHSRMEAVLAQDGHTLLHATSGVQALELVDELHPALAFIDIHMPGMNGLELIKRLRAKTPGLTIFVISSGSIGALRVAAKRLGANAWVSKPAPDSILRSAASFAPCAA